MTVEQGTQSTTPEARQDVKPVASLADQYEFGEEATPTPPQNTPQATPPAVEGPVGAESAQPATSHRPTPPKDPATGRFVKAEEFIESTPGHPASLVQAALDYGIGDEVIASLTTDQLVTTVRGMDRKVSAQRVEGMHEQLTHDAVQSGQQRVQERQASVPPPIPEAAPQDDFSLGIDMEKEGFDPLILKAFNNLLGHVRRVDTRNKELSSQVDQLKGFEQARQNDSIADRCDRVFARHEQHFGNKPGRDMQAGEANFVRRLAVLNIVERDNSKSTLEAKLERAIGLVYGTRPKPAAPDPLEERTKAWQESTLRKPTHRNGAAEPKGAALAEQSVRDTLREMGGEDTNGTAGDDDFI